MHSQNVSDRYLKCNQQPEWANLIRDFLIDDLGHADIHVL